MERPELTAELYLEKVSSFIQQYAPPGCKMVLAELSNILEPGPDTIDSVVALRWEPVFACVITVFLRAPRTILEKHRVDVSWPAGSHDPASACAHAGLLHRVADFGAMLEAFMHEIYRERRISVARQDMRRIADRPQDFVGQFERDKPEQRKAVRKV